MNEPLVKTIEVPCDQNTAFAVFLEMGSWWPTSRFATSVMRGQSVQSLRVDARKGGRIVEVSSDGQEHVWGTIKVYDPPKYLNMDFHVPHPSESNQASVPWRCDSPRSARTRLVWSSRKATGKAWARRQLIASRVIARHVV